jgi:hypothetical protein
MQPKLDANTNILSFLTHDFIPKFEGGRNILQASSKLNKQYKLFNMTPSANIYITVIVKIP